MGGIDPFSDMFASADDLLGGSRPGAVKDLEEVDHAYPATDHTGTELHHDEAEVTPIAPDVPGDPNAAWLADLYAQFIDEPEAAAAAAANGSGKKRRRGEPNPVDVAFRSAEQDAEEKVSTLKRLMGALRKL